MKGLTVFEKKAHIYAIPAIGAAHLRIGNNQSPLSVCPLHLQNFAIGLIATVLDLESCLSVALYLLLVLLVYLSLRGGAGFHVLIVAQVQVIFGLTLSMLDLHLISSIKIVATFAFPSHLLGHSLVFVGHSQPPS